MNRTLIKLTTLPAHIPITASKAMAKAAALAVPAMLFAGEAFAQAAGNTLGSRMQAASTDLTTGGGYVLQIIGYLLGGAALLTGIYTIWQHTKNPNGQSRLGYGFVSVSSQRMEDFGDDLVSQSTGRFILGAGDEKEAEDIINRFRLTAAAAEVIRHRLKGPFEDGSGSPFLAVVTADNVTFEQMLVNSLGTVELWAFSTTPTDVALRNRLYERVGFTEGLRRLSRVFPAGTARAELEERKNARLRRGEEGGCAQAGVIEDLADELVNGRGLGIVLRQHRAGAEAHEAAEQDADA